MMAKKRRKGVPNVYLWCSKVEKGRSAGLEMAGGRNCVIKVEGTKKCMHHGEPARCVETAFMYQVPPVSYPRYRRKK